MRPDLFLGIDAGTTGAKARLYTLDGTCHGSGSAAFGLDSPRPGLYLQDALDWRTGVSQAVRGACRGVDPRRIAAIAVSAQGGALVPMDADAQPLAPAISWLDRRATDAATAFAETFGPDELYRRTGWPVAPNNTAAQLYHLARHDPDLVRRARYFGDTAAALNGWLCGTPVIDTNVAGITQMMNLETLRWDEKVMDLIGLSTDALPTLVHPGTAVGTLTPAAAQELGLHPGVLIVAGAHDQYCAALGAGAVNPGDILLSTGTAWVALAVATSLFPNPKGQFGSGRHFKTELWGHFGEVSNGGVSLDWARAMLGHGRVEPLPMTELGPLVESVDPGVHGLRFLPYFDGTSPFPDGGNSSGSLVGLSLAHQAADVLRAVMEGLVFALRALVDDYVNTVGGYAVPRYHVVGGATRSQPWMQILTDTFGVPMAVSTEADTACVGAAALAATGHGSFADPLAATAAMQATGEELEPDQSRVQTYDHAYHDFVATAQALDAIPVVGDRKGYR
jgi:sugar (pentulose or hexulose) kinase